ncbi:glutamate-cysteine ligase family protein [Actinomadura madurae]|nr:glutamate-cysteine ligase family protein [Actinomadura madurae]MCQ0011566.1 glutamate-cysteine ligase family protein [Actinomadura madurae]
MRRAAGVGGDAGAGRPCAAGRAGERFGAIVAAYGEVVRDYQACGCHVHVGVPDRDTAVAVVNHLRPWLPVLMALSVNSAFDRGRAAGIRAAGRWRCRGSRGRGCRRGRRRRPSTTRGWRRWWRRGRWWTRR